MLCQINEKMVTILARDNLPRDSVSDVIFKEDFHGPNVIKEDLIYLDTNALGQLTLVDLKNKPLPFECIQYLTLAEDVQSKNLELNCYETVGSNHVAFRLRVVKDVSCRAKVELWFSEDILARLGMPFLTPANIKDRSNYVCHKCGYQFEKPNPLKVHLFLNCNKFTPRLFWRKFIDSFTDHTAPLNLTTNTRPRSHESFNSNHQFPTMRRLSEPPFSAFRPIHPRVNNNYNTPLVYPNINFHAAMSLKQVIPKQVNEVTKNFSNISIVNPVEIEAFATSWGKSRDGHVCLYCGRVYSRKYGLKIHIRTHTGYKPLQCKYCLRPFGDPSNLNKHVRLHTQSETPYSCSLCGKTLVRKRDLERHIKRTHCEETKYNPDNSNNLD